LRIVKIMTKAFCILIKLCVFNSVKMLVDCQQLKLMGARTAGRTAACNYFILTACVHNMTWGEPGTLSWTWAESETATGCVASIWEEDDSLLISV
jgi:hypothetical protein